MRGQGARAGGEGASSNPRGVCRIEPRARLSDTNRKSQDVTRTFVVTSTDRDLQQHLARGARPTRNGYLTLTFVATGVTGTARHRVQHRRAHERANRVRRRSEHVRVTVPVRGSAQAFAGDSPWDGRPSRGDRVARRERDRGPGDQTDPIPGSATIPSPRQSRWRAAAPSASAAPRQWLSLPTAATTAVAPPATRVRPRAPRPPGHRTHAPVGWPRHCDGAAGTSPERRDDNHATINRATADFSTTPRWGRRLRSTSTS